MSSWEIAYIGIGSNLGDRAANLDRALSHLRSVEGVEVLSRSRLIETAPVGGPPQPDYLNGAVRLRTLLSPERLLAVLEEAERVAGRKPSAVRWGPREADLDLLLYGDRVIRSERLVVPHPRMSRRRFVLEPLAEIAPDARDPVTGRTVLEMLRDVAEDRKGMT